MKSTEFLEEEATREGRDDIFKEEKASYVMYIYVYGTYIPCFLIYIYIILAHTQ